MKNDNEKAPSRQLRGPWRLCLELLICLFIGFAAGTAAGIMLWAIGALTGGVRTGLEAARTGLMLIGALLLLAGAAGFLKGSHLPEDTFRLPDILARFLPNQRLSGFPDAADFSSNARFAWLRMISRRAGLILTGAGVLLVSAVPDYILMKL